MTRRRQDGIDFEGVKDIFNCNGGAVAPFGFGIQVDRNFVFATRIAVGKHGFQLAAQLVIGEQGFVGDSAVAVNGEVRIVIQGIECRRWCPVKAADVQSLAASVLRLNRLGGSLVFFFATDKEQGTEGGCQGEQLLRTDFSSASQRILYIPIIHILNLVCF